MVDDSTKLPDVSALLLDTETLDGFLQLLADKAVSYAPEADGCGITLERQNRPLTVASSGSSALVLDEAQYGQDDGPCLQALRTGKEVAVTDMLDETRWGPYPAYAVTHGARSSLSLPIAAHTHTAGALNLYSPAPHGFDNARLTALHSLASQATGAIAIAQRIADAQDFTDDLRNALKSRAVIDQAIGVIMGQQRCAADAAFQILRSASQHRNLKLRDLCADLLTKISGGQPPENTDFRPRP
jgi:GAF domain-containing protein